MAAKTKKETAAVAETKETAKKATVKKTREVYLQWYGKEVQLSSITARIEEMWKKEMKRKISELVDLKVYVKPEEGKAHYVINGEITGSIELLLRRRQSLCENIGAVLFFLYRAK